MCFTWGRLRLFSGTESGHGAALEQSGANFPELSPREGLGISIVGHTPPSLRSGGGFFVPPARKRGLSVRGTSDCVLGLAGLPDRVISGLRGLREETITGESSSAFCF